MPEKASDVVYCLNAVIQDVLYDAERGKCTWEEALFSIQDHVHSAVEIYEDKDDDKE